MTEAKETHAVYAGSFDPPTLGHEWMIDEALKLFSRLTIVIARNPAKKYTFSYEQRSGMLMSVPDGVLTKYAQHMNIRIATINNELLVDWAAKVTPPVTHLVRGVRNLEDFEYERAMRNVNADRNPAMSTVFLVPLRHLCEISSSFVKGLVGLSGWESLVGKYVSRSVLQALKLNAP